jgi:hypothetical protein
MKKPEKVREIYAELKSVYGVAMTSRELLECASLMVQASEDSLYEPKTDFRVGRSPFSELPVNMIIENWSWKVMNREMIWDDDYIPHEPQSVMIERCLEYAA